MADDNGAVYKMDASIGVLGHDRQFQIEGDYNGL
ncbi:MAG: hypothetical protein ACI9JM_001721 [Halioglobus sp.]|jgi:hypothetical protein